ncbi:hypothetical protein D3C80_930250 [compost metagenome]
MSYEFEAICISGYSLRRSRHASVASFSPFAAQAFHPPGRQPVPVSGNRSACSAAGRRRRPPDHRGRRRPPENHPAPVVRNRRLSRHFAGARGTRFCGGHGGGGDLDAAAIARRGQPVRPVRSPCARSRRLPHSCGPGRRGFAGRTHRDPGHRAHLAVFGLWLYRAGIRRSQPRRRLRGETDRERGAALHRQRLPLEQRQFHRPGRSARRRVHAVGQFPACQRQGRSRCSGARQRLHPLGRSLPNRRQDFGRLCDHGEDPAGLRAAGFL